MRSFCIEDGQYTATPSDIEFWQGLKTEEDLHEFVGSSAIPERTFAELYVPASEQIYALGYENLDFLGNLCHSIEQDPVDRVYSDQHSEVRPGDVRVFVFEPRIRKRNGRWAQAREHQFLFAGWVTGRVVIRNDLFQVPRQ